MFANTELDSLKRIVETIEEDSLKFVTYSRIAYLLYNGEEAIQYAEKALTLAKMMDNKSFRGLAYHRLAWCHSYENMDKKTVFLDSAEMVFSELNDLNGLGRTFDTKGSIMNNYGSTEDAKIAYQKGYTYYEEANNEERQAGILNNWAIALYESGEPEKAILKYQEALAYRKQENPENPIETARLYHGLGECSKLLGDFSTATKHYLESFRYRHKIKNIGIAESLISISKMTYEVAERGQDTMGIHRLLLEFGLPSSAAALDSAARVPGVAERKGFQLAIMEVQQKRYVVQGNYKKAYDLLSEFKALEDDGRLSESNLEALADLKLKYEKERINTQLLEEEIINRKKEDQVNLLLLSLAILLSALIIGTLIYQNRLKEKSLQLVAAKQEQQIIAMRSMLKGQEKERSRIARDLHDGLGNLLSTLKANVGSLQLNFTNKNTEKIYLNASEMIDEACTEVRKIAHEMMPQSLSKLGFRKAIEDLVFKMNSSHEFDVDFQVYGEEHVLDDTTNVMLYRIVQELFNNISKYAEAKEVVLQMTYGEDWLNLTVEDDGKGFEVSSKDVGEGMGLKSIAFRTEYIGGDYEIDSREGKGTLVSINVPYTKKNGSPQFANQ